ncbi:MAG: hypothetical protein ACO2OZ_03480 [Acidilobaceae archaeon]|jgi:hypothetical protein
MELVEALIHVVNISTVIVYPVMAIVLFIIFKNVITGRSATLKSLEARLPRGISLTPRILASLLLIVVIVSCAQTAYKGLTGSFGYEIYRFGGDLLLLLMALFGTILSLFFIAGFTVLALRRVRSSTFRS